ncbi:DUF1330 domain-containing protein [Streptomyces iranensis]|uniref:Uncharacterized protein (DUF1330 family) n=1 Tax=Streptomyces iranensis TaxID=576784 RepID=A0A060ZUW6_9ACTN|nr:DUF1330 domain-containing protein [Streptomyces iranensis]MBP2067134.1 uncharacterized protein (DUF1330 family) [Streptomyces iranensis]CDR07243.1 predicted protein [Streptomyces iranensis]
MPAAYALAHLHGRTPHPDAIEYLERIQGTLDPFHGRFLIHGDTLEVVEGEWPGSVVLIEFPGGMADAREWYASPAYQDILTLRTDHTDGDVILADGVGPGYDPLKRAEQLRSADPSAYAR